MIPPRSRLRHALFAIFVLVCVLSLGWPVYPWMGARLSPHVLGVPFSLAWVVGWILLSFLALFLYEWTRPRGPRE